MRASVVFCRLVRGLLNIDSALTFISFPRRDDADDFFFVAISMLLAIGVDHEQDCCFHHSDGVPSLLALDDAILAEKCIGIIENPCRDFECDPMFLLVASVLSFVPLEAHRYTYCITALESVGSTLPLRRAVCTSLD